MFSDVRIKFVLIFLAFVSVSLRAESFAERYGRLRARLAGDTLFTRLDSAEVFEFLALPNERHDDAPKMKADVLRWLIERHDPAVRDEVAELVKFISTQTYFSDGGIPLAQARELFSAVLPELEAFVGREKTHQGNEVLGAVATVLQGQDPDSPAWVRTALLGLLRRGSASELDRMHAFMQLRHWGKNDPRWLAYLKTDLSADPLRSPDLVADRYLIAGMSQASEAPIVVEHLGGLVEKLHSAQLLDPATRMAVRSALKLTKDPSARLDRLLQLLDKVKELSGAPLAADYPPHLFYEMLRESGDPYLNTGDPATRLKAFVVAAYGGGTEIPARLIGKDGQHIRAKSARPNLPASPAILREALRVLRDPSSPSALVDLVAGTFAPMAAGIPEIEEALVARLANGSPFLRRQVATAFVDMGKYRPELAVPVAELYAHVRKTDTRFVRRVGDWMKKAPPIADPSVIEALVAGAHAGYGESAKKQYPPLALLLKAQGLHERVLAAAELRMRGMDPTELARLKQKLWRTPFACARLLVEVGL